MGNCCNDLLIDRIVDDSLLASGVPAPFIVANGGSARGIIGNDTSKASRSPRWAQDEDDFLRTSMGDLSYADIGAALGRSANAVKVRAVRLQAGCQTRKHGYLTLNKASFLIGCDAHKLSGWVQHGIMKAEIAPTESRNVTRISLEYLKYWLTRPNNWPYFNAHKMKPGYLKSLVFKAKERWGDEWLTMRQMANMHGIKNVQTVSRTVMNGNYPGIRCPHIGGRDAANWSLWFVRKSVAELWVKPSCKDARLHWVTPAARDFMLRMRAKGYNAVQIGRMMKRPSFTVGYLLRTYKADLPEAQVAEIFKMRIHRGKNANKERKI